MPLTDFIERPNVREAIKFYVKLPKAFPELGTIIVPSCGVLHGVVGMAFELMACLKIWRDFGLSEPWTGLSLAAEAALVRSSCSATGRNSFKPWHDRLVIANSLALEYLNKVIDCTAELACSLQNVALLDMYYRCGLINHDFQPVPELSAEIIKLESQFKPIEIFKHPSVIKIAPTFVSGNKIGGAHGDLLLDDTLVDFKTVSSMKKFPDTLRQMIGYAALDLLHPDGTGISLKNKVKRKAPVTKIAVYFSRQARLVSWSLDSLFDTEQDMKDFLKLFRAAM